MQSLRVVETPEFRRLLLFLREDIDDSAIPKRTKIRNAVMDSLDNFFVRLKNDIHVCFSQCFAHDLLNNFLPYQNSLGKVSFTADMWSDKKMQSFLAVTAHWISRNDTGTLELKSSLIAFHRVWGQHTGKNLAVIVLNLLDRAGATSKVNNMQYQYEMCRLTEIVQDWTFYIRQRSQQQNDDERITNPVG